MIFKRKKQDVDESTDLDSTGDQVENTPPDPATAPETTNDEIGGRSPEATADFDRSDGPFDLGEVEDADAMSAQRIDLGCVQIPLVDGLEIRVEVDQESNVPVAVTLIHGPGAVQVRAFAAPRSGGAWAEAIRDVRRQLTGDGGTVDQSVGTFGTELRATVSAQDEQGRPVLQPIRFVGVDGPRWMLQGVLLGAGADPATAAELEDLYRSIVVVRGDTAMPMGTLLPLALPQEVPGDVEQHEEIVEVDGDDPEQD